MTAEKSTEYEPSLTVEMERFTLSDAELQRLGRNIKSGQTRNHINKVARYRMTVIKDRANILAGMHEFDPMPGDFIKPDNNIFAAVQPFLNKLSVGKKLEGIDLKRNSKEVFDDGDQNVHARNIKRSILLENIKAELEQRFGMSQEDKKSRMATLKRFFGTYSKTEMENMELSRLQDGYDMMWAEFHPDDPPPTDDADMPPIMKKVEKEFG